MENCKVRKTQKPEDGEKPGADSKLAKRENRPNMQNEETDDEKGSDVLIYKLPPEIWDKIFEYGDTFLDCMNISNVCPYFKDVLYSTRTAWLFELAFPLIFEHLSKHDVLQCRLMSKRWQSAVDGFLQTHPFHYPALEKVRRGTEGEKAYFTEYHTELRLEPLKTVFQNKRLDYIDFTDMERANIFSLEAVHHPRCPFVGKSVCVSETQNIPEPTPSMRFLEMFGKQISHLKLTIDMFPDFDWLTRFLCMIKDSKNLKKLELHGCIERDRRLHNRMAIWIAVEQMNQFIRNEITPELRLQLPKLDTFSLHIANNHRKKLAMVLLALLGHRHLKSLETNVLPQAPNLSGLDNLKRLIISIDFTCQLKCLLQITPSLQMLSLEMRCRVKAVDILHAICRFRLHLRQLVLRLSLDFFDGEVLRCVNLPVQMRAFSDPEILTDFTNLKRITLILMRPISFNFLYGVRSTLEYLHISIKDMGHWHQFLSVVFPEHVLMEKVDLLKYLKLLPESGKYLLYESNVWNIFRKLRVLTVHLCAIKCHREGGEWEYRRDVYDKLQCGKVIAG